MLCEQLKINVSGQEADLFTYFLDNSKEIDPERKRPLVLIFPGGGYQFTSDREAEPVAIQFNAMGFHAAVLRYSTPGTYPAPVLQAAKAISLIREHAAQWNVDPDKIILCGFSAGGHLAAWTGTHWHKDYIKEALGGDSKDYRPNGMILCYPVISSGAFAHEGSFRTLLGEGYEELKDFVSLEKQVDENTPPTFLWHTFEDDCVPMENSLLMASALRQSGISTEMHIYPKGSHGLSLASEETRSYISKVVQPECQNWISMAGTWIRGLFM